MPMSVAPVDGANSLLAKGQWMPHPSLPAELVATISKFIQQLPEVHCEEPIDGEQYPWPNIILDRLQDFAFTKGFAVVTLSGSQNKGRMRFGCVHHGKPRDTRKIDNSDTSLKRKRQTTTLAKDCNWAVNCILKEDESGVGQWILSVSERLHSHPLAPNPLVYIQHKRRNEDYQQAIAQAIHHRQAGLSYNISLHLRAGEGLQLNPKAYYNTKRSSKIPVSAEERIDRTLKELTTAGFHTRSRWSNKLDGDGSIIAQQLEQIFFINGNQIRLGRRFISDFVMECDATFSNNLLQMPLANIVGITNTGRTFSLAFSFIRSESAENFDFIFSSLDELVFYDIPCPRVVLSDQAKGFIKSLADQWSSYTFHQLCEWHMVQNIKKRLVEGAYNKDQQDHIQHLVWKYIHNTRQDKVEEVRNNLYYELHVAERQYMEENWRQKEIQVLRCHTQRYPNLGAFSTQRNEGHHVAVKQFLNPQITLEQATARLSEHLQNAILRLDAEEAESRTKVPRFLDSEVFQHLIGKVTLFAIDKVKVEWEEAKKLVNEMDLEDCGCTIISQFGLPCRHRLAIICFSPTLQKLSIPIPIELFHPRWKIEAEALSNTPWVMPSGPLIDPPIDPALTSLAIIQHDQYQNNGKDLLLRSLHSLELLQGQLMAHDSEAAERMAHKVHVFSNAILEEFELATQAQAVPRVFAPVGTGSTLPQRRSKGKAKGRTLTSGELAERKSKSRSKRSKVNVPVEGGETQECIQVISSTAPA